MPPRNAKNARNRLSGAGRPRRTGSANARPPCVEWVSSRLSGSPRPSDNRSQPPRPGDAEPRRLSSQRSSRAQGRVHADRAALVWRGDLGRLSMSLGHRASASENAQDRRGEGRGSARGCEVRDPSRSPANKVRRHGTKEDGRPIESRKLRSVIHRQSRTTGGGEWELAAGHGRPTIAMET